MIVIPFLPPRRTARCPWKVAGNLSYSTPGFVALRVAENLRSALAHLDDFLDVHPDQLPTEPMANAKVGSELRDT